MITKDQANRIAESLLDQEQKIQHQAKNAKARSIPFYFRCPEVLSLEPWQQAKVVRQAAKNVTHQWRLRLSIVAWVGVCLAVWHFAFPSTTTVSLALFLFAAAVIPQIIVQLWLIRREIQSLARLRQFRS